MKVQGVFDFEEVKGSVNIRPYIESAVNTRGKPLGDATYRIIPCPYCKSDSGFTINEPGQFYKCFSCGEGGDVIAFEQRFGGHENARAAAEAIAQKQGISIDGRPAPVPTTSKQLPPPPPPDQEPTQGKRSTSISSDRGSEVRLVAVEYYHQRLLEDSEALKYQTEKRKHTVETLKEFKVGLGGGNLKKHCEEQGVALEELQAVGLMQKRGPGIGAWVPKGNWTYPHMVNGQCLHISMKAPTKTARNYGGVT